MTNSAAWRTLRITMAVVAVGFLVPVPSDAQNYRFGVEEMELQVFVQPDASVRLQYKIVFNNAGDPIDIVDIGLPHRDYDISNMTAAVDGAEIRDIRTSEYTDIGVEVHLHGKAIPSGKKGTFHFSCTMPDRVYEDTTSSDDASLQIRPTWFDPQLQIGSTKLNIMVHLPPGIRADEVKWQSDDLPYDELAVVGEGDDQHLVAWWKFPGHTLRESNPKVGISFPRRVMDRVVTVNAFQLLVKWFAESPGAQLVSGLLLAAAVGFLFFRFSGGTGIVVFLVLIGVVGLFLFSRPAWHLISWPIAIGLIALNEWARGRRRSKYLPAMATVEGGGIKRGLTAPQAALLLELPLGKVLTLVLMGLMKKGVLRQTSTDPLTVEIDEAFRVNRKKRRKAAADQGIVLHDYEQSFLDRLVGWDKPVEQRELSKPVGNMVLALAQQMKGFDLSDTQEYYRRIVSRAWKEAESIGEIKRRDETVDRNFDWMVLAPNYSDRFDTWGHRGYHYRPSWTGSGGSSSAPSVGGSSRSGPSASQTSFSEVAASFAGWTENTSASLASAIEPGGMGIETPSSGLLDLSGFDKVTADVLESLAENSGGSGGGGGGGGCACACAGCACACACAGGGR